MKYMNNICILQLIYIVNCIYINNYFLASAKKNEIPPKKIRNGFGLLGSTVSANFFEVEVKI